jgi:fumarate reductase subunit D
MYCLHNIKKALMIPIIIKIVGQCVTTANATDNVVHCHFISLLCLVITIVVLFYLIIHAMHPSETSYNITNSVSNRLCRNFLRL